MKPLSEILSLSKEYVLSQRHGRPKHEIEEFIAITLGFKSRLDLYVNYDKPLSDKELELIRPGLKRLGRGEPVAYVLGVQHFYGHDFTVTNSVLIPRPETEILVEKALGIIDRASSSLQKYEVLDCCCGSGCIGLTVKKERPQVEMTLFDISSKALAVAKENGGRLQVEVSYIESDLFTEALRQKKQYALVLCNPPYLTQNEWETADFSVKHYEPELALIGGKSGVELYERIASTLSDVLLEGGEFLLEIGAGQGGKVSSLFRNAGFKNVSVHKDFQGRDRVVSGLKSSS